MKSPKLQVSKQFVSSGYDLGYNKGSSFAATFEKREYFEKNIRLANKRNF